MRRAYYNAFSGFYDRFIALHSSDRKGFARTFLANQVPVQESGAVLDLCTGTGSVLPDLHRKVGPKGCVVGLDFSRGMLTVGQEKIKGFPNIHLVEAEVEWLPFPAAAFDAVTCSHAFYELKEGAQEEALSEVLRVLRPMGTFLMMEHDVPRNPIVRGLFYLRLVSMGMGRAVSILRCEQDLLKKYFGRVDKIHTPEGKSKILTCWNGKQ
jgi:demethylmenaquinone methyltransferase/2-methoxy-6-polyprenyl-1,4-benzoquinol methylase